MLHPFAPHHHPQGRAVEVDVLRSSRLLLILTLASACQGADGPALDEDPAAGQTADPGSVTAFAGATVWDGTGAPSLPDAVILVRDGRVAAVGSSGEVEVLK